MAEGTSSKGKGELTEARAHGVATRLRLVTEACRAFLLCQNLFGSLLGLEEVRHLSPGHESSASTYFLEYALGGEGRMRGVLGIRKLELKSVLQGVHPFAFLSFSPHLKSQRIDRGLRSNET